MIGTSLIVVGSVSAIVLSVFHAGTMIAKSTALGLVVSGFALQLISIIISRIRFEREMRKKKETHERVLRHAQALPPKQAIGVLLRNITGRRNRIPVDSEMKRTVLPMAALFFYRDPERLLRREDASSGICSGILGGGGGWIQKRHPTRTLSEPGMRGRTVKCIRTHFPLFDLFPMPRGAERMIFREQADAVSGPCPGLTRDPHGDRMA